MNMRVNPGGAMNDMSSKLNMSSLFKGQLQGGGSNALSQNTPGGLAGKSGMLQYGGAEGSTSEGASKGGLSSDYQSLMKSLIDQGRAEMQKLKEQLAQEMSAGPQQSGTGHQRKQRGQQDAECNVAVANVAGQHHETD